MISFLREFNLSHKLISLIEITKPTLVKSRLRQGDSMSPILFNLILERVVREMNIQPREGFQLQESPIAVLAYADDVVLISELYTSLRSLGIYSIGGSSKERGITVNEEKIEYMVMGRRDGMADFPHLKFGNYEFRRAKQFKYLGSILTEKNETDKEINALMESQKYYVHHFVNRNEETIIYNLNMPSCHL